MDRRNGSFKLKTVLEIEEKKWEQAITRAKEGDLLPLLSIHRGKALIQKMGKELGIEMRYFLTKIIRIDDEDFISSLKINLPEFNITE